ncbi:hypothetical protein JB92DRAFT_3118558 [Gautieria morchelliformis]|nr:hypothetical protein JB92DRAFT_3118558 [Gautieria morchelliformis]
MVAQYSSLSPDYPPPNLPSHKRLFHSAFNHEEENQDPHTPLRSPPPPMAAPPPTTLPLTKVEAISTQMGLSPTQRHNLLSFAKLLTSVYTLAEAMSIKSLVQHLVDTQGKLYMELEGLRGQVRAGWSPDENLHLAILALVKHALADGEHARISKLWMDIEVPLYALVYPRSDAALSCRLVSRTSGNNGTSKRSLPTPCSGARSAQSSSISARKDASSHIYASISPGGTGQDLDGFVYQFLNKHLTHGVPQDILRTYVARAIVLADKDPDSPDRLATKPKGGRGRKPKGHTFWDLAEQELLRIQKAYEKDPHGYKQYIKSLIEADHQANGHQTSINAPNRGSQWLPCKGELVVRVEWGSERVSILQIESLEDFLYPVQVPQILDLEYGAQLVLEPADHTSGIPGHGKIVDVHRDDEGVLPDIPVKDRVLDLTLCKPKSEHDPAEHIIPFSA